MPKRKSDPNALAEGAPVPVSVPVPVPTREFKRTFHVTLQIVDRIDGGIPQNKDLIRTWLNVNFSKGGVSGSPMTKEAIDANPDMFDELTRKFSEGTVTEKDLDAHVEKMSTTFMKNTLGQPCIEARCVKSMLRQTGSVMGLQGALPGLFEMLKEGLEVTPALIPLGVDESCVENETIPTQPDKSPGAQSALKRVKFIQKPRIEFDISIMDRDAIAAYWMFKFRGVNSGQTRKGVPTVPEELLRDVLLYAGEFIHLGANRSQGRGKFELVELKQTGGGTDMRVMRPAAAK